jgi:hypothetical protein
MDMQLSSLLSLGPVVFGAAMGSLFAYRREPKPFVGRDQLNFTA